MQFKDLKHTLRCKNYHKYKILLKFIEFNLKNFLKLIIKINFPKKVKAIINLGNYQDNRYINLSKSKPVLVFDNHKSVGRFYKKIKKNN